MSQRRWNLTDVGVTATIALVGVLVATRRGPLMSPDSIHYLATAEHLRSFDGITDLTGDPMTIFPPVFPLLLSLGGTSLGWARLVGAFALATVAVAMYAGVRRVSGRWAGLVAAVLVASAPVLLRVASTVWSETPYMALSMAALTVAAGAPTRRRVLGVGLLCSLGFLTRYAGAGLIAAVAVMLVVAVCHEQHRWKPLGIFAVAVTGPIAAWMVRNVNVSGQALGARFSGGSQQTWPDVFALAIRAGGETLIRPHASAGAQRTVGWLIVASLALALGLIVGRVGRGQRVERLDLGMVVYGLAAFVVPVVARKATSNDIEYRVMSPVIIPAIYLAVRAATVVLARLRSASRVVFVVGAATMGAFAAVWAMAGVVAIHDFPSNLDGSAGNRNERRFSQALYDAVERLPADVWVTTNNPHRLWWHSHRDPTLFAFVAPRPGNSLYPLEAEALTERVCERPTYLAWFRQFNKPTDGPAERRPDLAAIFTLDTVQTFDQGELYRVVLPPAACTGR